MGPVICGRSPVYPPGRDPLCLMLRKVLLDGVRARRGATCEIGSVEGRAVVTLYSLLRDHSVDHWDYCRSCRRPGSILGPQWQLCQVHSKATLCLRQLDELLLRSMLAEE